MREAREGDDHLGAGEPQLGVAAREREGGVGDPLHAGELRGDPAPEVALRVHRAAVGAEHIRVFADIKKKHSSHAITGDVDIVETAHAAEFAFADGVIVTGTATGRAANPAEVEAVASAVRIPVFVGSGITPDNVAAFAMADGLIVGSSVKQRGDWRLPLDLTATKRLADAFHAWGPNR